MRNTKRSGCFRTPRNCTILGWRSFAHKVNSFRKLSLKTKTKRHIITMIELLQETSLIYTVCLHNRNHILSTRMMDAFPKLLKQMTGYMHTDLLCFPLPALQLPWFINWNLFVLTNYYQVIFLSPPDSKLHLLLTIDLKRRQLWNDVSRWT